MQPMLRGAMVLALLILGAANATAGLVNGDFETGDLTGWTTFTTSNGSNGAGLPNVVSFDTTGSGASFAAHFQVGGTPGPFTQGGGIFQNINLVADTYTIALDVASQNTGGDPESDGGLFSLFLDGVEEDYVLLGPIGAGVTLRPNSLTSLIITRPLAAGVHEIRIQITRGSEANSNINQYIDYVTVTGTSVAAVPEPASFALWLAGAACLLGSRRRDG